MGAIPLPAQKLRQTEMRCNSEKVTAGGAHKVVLSDQE